MAVVSVVLAEDIGLVVRAGAGAGRVGVVDVDRIVARALALEVALAAGVRFACGASSGTFSEVSLGSNVPPR